MKRLNYFMTGILLIVALCINLNSTFAKSGPITVCYVETNGSSIESVGKYTLASTGENVFDIAIIFAGNINYDDVAQKAVLHLNQGVVDNLPRVGALQSKGIKVLLSLLGNHQGVGVCNFADYNAAYDFAQQCKNVVDQYGLDGIDIDDEYAKYGTNGQPGANAYSFVYFVTALRELMPDKIISFYYYGTAKSYQSYNGVTVGSKIDYSWNAMYGTYSAPNVPGLTNDQLAPAAVWINNTSTTTAANNATRTVNDGYGVYLTYALPDTDEHTYVSAFTNPLYGSDAVFGSTGGTAPGAAINPNPGNAETNVSITPTLSWTSGSGAASHNVYFGTSNPPASQGNQSGTTFTPGTLITNTTYYWRIDEVNSYGTTTGNVWSFTTEANATTNLAPDAAISVSSEYPNATWSKEKLTDGISGQFGNGEWASDGEQTPWAQLNWSQSVVTSKVVLYDRSITNENINSGTLTFSDGSSVAVGALPVDGTALEVDFSERTITWVKFQVDQGEGPNNGMSEFEVIGYYGGTAPTPPIADFSANTTTVDEGGSVSFTDNSANTPTSWSWTFDGGTPSSSTAQNPTVTYNTAGTYNVALTATNADGSDTETKTGFITVNVVQLNPPVADFSANTTTITEGGSVSFSDNSTNNPTSWSWTFDGGTPSSSTAQNPAVTYNTPGNYNVTLTATNADGSDTETKTAYITVNAQSGGGDYASFPYSTGFESGSVDSYWTLQTENSYGRIQVTSANSPNGSYHLTSDVTTNANFSTNSASLKIDLSGQTSVKLSFNWKEFSDEDHTEDGVFLSDDGGATFSKVYNLTGGSTSYTFVELDIDQLASSNGLNLNGTFVIKFQQRDNYSIATDGIAWDDISVTEGGAASITNLAPDASITVSSEYPNATWSKEKLTDGISGQFGNGEWASDGEQTPWAQLNWSQSVVTSKVVLYDRSLTNENINSGTLTFSDGSSVAVGALPVDGTALDVDFSERTITWVKFQVDQGEGPNNGMSEFEVIGHYDNLKSAADKEEVNTLIAIKVYPNPVKDVFTVEFPGESITRLAIFDIQGRLVYQNEFKDRIQISTDEISGSGILFIKLANESNTYIERIVIE